MSSIGGLGERKLPQCRYRTRNAARTPLHMATSDQRSPYPRSRQVDWRTACISSRSVRTRPKNNSRRKRACSILRSLWQRFPSVYFLCAIGTSIGRLGRLRSIDYLKVIDDWHSTRKSTTAMPRGLVLTMERYGSMLPSSLTNKTLAGSHRHPTFLAQIQLYQLLDIIMQQLPNVQGHL